MDMFKIESTGSFKASRGDLLVSCIQEECRGDPDLVIVSQDGDIIPTHRCVLGLYGGTLPSVLNTIACCQNIAVSLPFSTRTISALLKLTSLGYCSSLDRAGLASLTECAQVLGISLQGLEIVEQKKVVTVEVGEGMGLKSLLSSVEGRAGPSTPPHWAWGPAKPTRGPRKSKKRKIADTSVQREAGLQEDQQSTKSRMNDEDIIVITPEMYAEEDESDRDMALLPQHFLMQGGGDDDSYSEGGGGWDAEDSSWDIHNPQGRPLGHGDLSIDLEQEEHVMPEVKEFPSEEDPETKVFACSFCPGQVFKKRNDINRHLKKHVPIEMRKRFQCEMCKEKFINNSNLKVHMKVCTGVVKEFLCKKCGEVQHNKTDHLDHLARMHNINKKHSCPICHKQLKKTSDLKKHMSTHSNQKPFTCSVCGKRFKTESYVKVHMKAHYVNGHVPSNGVDQDEENMEAEDAKTAEKLTNGAGDSNGDSDRFSDDETMNTSEGFKEASEENNGPDTDGPTGSELTGSKEDQVELQQPAADVEEEDVEGVAEAYDDGGVSEGIDTPSGVGTPETQEGRGEGGSTSDEMELQEQGGIQFPNKDMYVAQMNLFRNPTQII